MQGQTTNSTLSNIPPAATLDNPPNANATILHNTPPSAASLHNTLSLLQASTSTNYNAQDTLTRVSSKLYNSTPADLPTDLKNSLVQLLACSPSSMEAAIKAGCVLLTVQARVRNPPPDAAEMATRLMEGHAFWRTRAWTVCVCGEGGVVWGCHVWVLGTCCMLLLCGRVVWGRVVWLMTRVSPPGCMSKCAYPPHLPDTHNAGANRQLHCVGGRWTCHTRPASPQGQHPTVCPAAPHPHS